MGKLALSNNLQRYRDIVLYSKVDNETTRHAHNLIITSFSDKHYRLSILFDL